MINDSKTTKYHKLEVLTRQGDPISAYLFILVLIYLFIYLFIYTSYLFILVLVLSIKENEKIINHAFLYTAYAGDTIFFLRDKEL